MPEKFDINGPYGIAKGRTVGIEAFKNKLHQKGHEKYFALFGLTEKRLGFHALFDANRPNTTYTEIIFWYKKGLYSVSFKDLAQIVIGPLSASCAFQFDFVEGLDIFVESKIKNGFFGISVKVNSTHKECIDKYENGGYRDIFAVNLFNSTQYSTVTKMHPDIIGGSFSDKYLETINA